MNSGEILIYENQEGNIKIDVRLEEETVWLTQGQLCELFQKSKATISEHIANVFEEGELDEKATVRKFRTVQREGSRIVERELEYYNLDVTISVGYRVKSPQGTQFRTWATQRLKEYIIKGFALNDDRFKSGSSRNYFDEHVEKDDLTFDSKGNRLSHRAFITRIEKAESDVKSGKYLTIDQLEKESEKW